MVTTLTSPRLTRANLSVIGLLAVTASWGSTFFMLKGVTSRMPVADFLTARFLIAAAGLWLVAPRSVFRLSPLARRRALMLGAVYGAAQVLQGIGLQTTSASVSGFVTGMYVVLTPVLGALILKQKLGWQVWAAVGLATAGLGLLSLQGLSIGRGEGLTLLGALLFAVHILGLSKWSESDDAIGMSVVQLGTAGVICAFAAVPHGFVLPSRTSDWMVLIYMALISGALAMFVQTWAQANVSATRAAIVMTMEPVWAAAFAIAFGGESLSMRAVFGGVLVLAAMYLVELGPRKPADVVPEAELADCRQ